MIENQQLIICGVVGQQKVGKTKLINKYFKNFYSDEYNPTIAVQMSYSSYQCHEGTMLRVKCWDTSGQNKYKNMICYHLKEVDIILLMFDLTCYQSLQKIGEWADRIKSEGVNAKVIYVVGNKRDLFESQRNCKQRDENQDSLKVPKITKQYIENRLKQLKIKVKYVQISVKNDNKFQFLDDAFEQVLQERSKQIIQLNNKNIMKCKDSNTNMNSNIRPLNKSTSKSGNINARNKQDKKVQNFQNIQNIKSIQTASVNSPCQCAVF